MCQCDALHALSCQVGSAADFWVTFRLPGWDYRTKPPGATLLDGCWYFRLFQLCECNWSNGAVFFFWGCNKNKHDCTGSMVNKKRALLVSRTGTSHLIRWIKTLLTILCRLNNVYNVSPWQRAQPASSNRVDGDCLCLYCKTASAMAQDFWRIGIETEREGVRSEKWFLFPAALEILSTLN